MLDRINGQDKDSRDKLLTELRERAEEMLEREEKNREEKENENVENEKTEERNNAGDQISIDPKSPVKHSTNSPTKRKSNIVPVIQDRFESEAESEGESESEAESEAEEREETVEEKEAEERLEEEQLRTNFRWSLRKVKQREPGHVYSKMVEFF